MPEIAPVTTLTETNVSALTGTPTVGGYQLLGDGTESVCLTNQSNSLENNIYTVPDDGGDWEPRADFVPEPLTEFWVLYGQFEHTKWALWNTETPLVGVDALEFQMINRGTPTEAGAGLERDGILIRLPDKGLAGTWQMPTIETDTYGMPISITSNVMGSAFIEGLALGYETPSQVSLQPGAAFIPGLNKIVSVDDELTATRLIGADALYYAYLTETNGVGQLELSTTEPSFPYFGYARTMEGSFTKRYLGMLRNDMNGDLISFEDEVMGGSTVLRIYGAVDNSDTIMTINNVTATTTLATRSIGPDAPNAEERLVPRSCRVASLRLEKGATNGLWFGWPVDPIYDRPPITFDSANTKHATGFIRISEDQEVHYQVPTSGTIAFYATVLGYIDRR